jgi:hypothetical protein
MNDESREPMTDKVFEQPSLDTNKHVLIQEGYLAIDQCCGHPPLSLPNGSLLKKDEGGYYLVDEVTKARI